MSRKGGDNHFISARDRDLKPLLDEACASLELDPKQAAMLDALLETAWLAGTRGGHAKLLNHAIRRREEHLGDDWDGSLKPVRIEDVEAEFKAIMEGSAEALDLSVSDTVALWDLLSRAWSVGARTYESEVAASLIERKADIVEEAQRWLDENGTGN